MDIYVDIGNTHTVFGILRNRQDKESKQTTDIRKNIEQNLRELRFSTKNIETSEDIYSSLFPFLKDEVLENNKLRLNNFIVSSVVPQLNFAIERFIEKYIDSANIYWVEARDDLGIDWQTEDYKEMGADRVADILGAIALYDDNFIIVDFGTAITIDIISNRKYIGGSISPGFLLLIKSLFQETAKLPMVEIKPTLKIAENTTIGQIQLGTVDIMCRGINNLIQEVKNHYGNLKVLLTGGFSTIAQKVIHCDDVVPMLQFIGMNYYALICKQRNNVRTGG
ncbi:MAG: type III pantothenate kinase [bacterium]